MDIFSVLSLIGGLALFLCGMNTMGDGLVKLSGGKLEGILERLTSNRIMALLTGAMVTAVIQSSSATTVMVVGFVNSGIMQLGQAVGIIMGANVGTTITSWLLSLTGIQGTSMVMQLLKPSSFSPVLAAIGIILTMTAKDNNKKKDTGGILLGFAILMFGMETMSDAVAPLADNEAFTSILVTFSNPILGMIAGAVLTAVIQSSSASVGILQALCATGAVGYSTAIPIIMGQNIGTCVTALISSVGASRNARRASMIHLYFNVIGTVLFMVVFYSVNKFVDFAFMDANVNPAGIAIIHSLFNVGCALVLFPFANVLVKLAKISVPGNEEEKNEDELPQKLMALDERFLDSPAFAMNLSRTAVEEMAMLATDSFSKALNNMKNYSADTVEEIKRTEELIDKYDDIIGSYLVKLSGGDMNVDDSRSMSVLLHCINDFERISDHARNMAENAEEMKEKGITLSDECLRDMDVFFGAIEEILQITVKSFQENDYELAKHVEPLEDTIDALCLEMKNRHVIRLRTGECSLFTGMYYEDIVTDAERVSDHCSNVAIYLIEIKQGEFDPHKYLEEIKDTEDRWFKKKAKEYKVKYALPDNGKEVV